MYMAMRVFMGLVMYAVTILSFLGLTNLLPIGNLSSDKMSTGGVVTCSDVPTSFIIFGAIASLGLIYLSALIHGEIVPILVSPTVLTGIILPCLSWDTTDIRLPPCSTSGCFLPTLT